MDIFAEYAIVYRLLSSLSCNTIGFKNSIKFASNIITDCVRHKREQSCRYKLVKWDIKGLFDIFNDTSDYVTLVQLIDNVGYVNHTVSITGYWVYYSN